MNLTKSQRQIIGLVFIVLVNTFALVYIYTLIESYQVNPFLPNVVKTNLPIRLYYPPPDNDKMEPIMISLWFNVTADGMITENTPITLTNFTGHVYTKNDIGIDVIAVGFFHTNLNEGQISDIDEENIIGPTLMPVGIQCHIEPCNSTLADIVPWHQQPPFSFPVGGDYSPTITVNVGNTSLQHTYNEIKVHVATSSELQSQELDRINVLISVALLVFADVELIWLLYEWQEKADKQNQPKQQKYPQSMGYS